MLKQLFTFFFLSFSFFSPFAQSLLSIDEALQLAMNQNYDVLISRNELNVAQSAVFYGNAGEQVATTLNLGENLQVTGLNQKFANGNEISKVGAVSNALNSQLAFAYPIFNNYRVRTTKGRIQEQVQLADSRAIAQIQNTCAQVMVRYYDICRQGKLLQSLQKSLAVSEKRLELIKVRQQVGMANSADLYLTELDLNARKQELQQQDLGLRQNKADLNTLLNRDEKIDFSVSDTIAISYTLQYEQLLGDAQKNADIQAAKEQIKIMDWMQKEIYAQRLPTARLNGGLAANMSNNTAGFQLRNINYGPFIGANISIPLFNQSIFDKQEQVIVVQKKTRELQAEALQNTIEGNLYKTWLAYKTSLSRNESEAQNVKIAQQYLDLVMQRYTLNQSNALELREAQRSYEDSVFRLTNVQYNAKVAEIELLRLAGKLVMR